MPVLCRSSRSKLAGRLTPPIGRRLLVRSRHGRTAGNSQLASALHPSAKRPELPPTNACHRHFCSAGSWAISSEHAKMLVGAAAAHAAARNDSSSTGTRSRLPLPTAVCTGCALGTLKGSFRANPCVIAGMTAGLLPLAPHRWCRTPWRMRASRPTHWSPTLAPRCASMLARRS